MKNALVVILFGIVIWFGASIVRLENERYALELEVCGRFDPTKPSTLTDRDDCLKRVQTRTGALYNLLYGLRVI